MRRGEGGRDRAFDQVKRKSEESREEGKVGQPKGADITKEKEKKGEKKGKPPTKSRTPRKMK